MSEVSEVLISKKIIKYMSHYLKSFFLNLWQNKLAECNKWFCFTNLSILKTLTKTNPENGDRFPI